MCTAVSYSNGSHYFGRNLDLEHWFCESVTITPRNFPFRFRMEEEISTHYAMIGIASVVSNYPLYYDATNECGLSIAGLNFPGNAFFLPPSEGKVNLAPFELIPWVLGNYATIKELRSILPCLNLTQTNFSEELPATPLHWLISDKENSIVLEPTNEGVKIYDNPIGILTNNPPFYFHLQNISNYLNVTSGEAVNRFAPALDLQAFSRGMGGIGLPGDLSSASRFVRAAFTLHNSVSLETEEQSVNQFFHILESVTQQNGCVKVGDRFEKTLYSACCNTDKGIYYYKTYDNSSITAVKLRSYDLNRTNLLSFPLRKTASIYYEN